MRFALNVIRTGMVGGACLSLLAACADGRGMGGFKSFRSTPEQRAEWLAKNGGGTPAPEGEETPVTTEETRTDGTVDPNQLADGATPGTEKTEPTAAAETTATTAAPNEELIREFPSEEAKTQVLTEFNRPASMDPEQDRVVDQAELTVVTDSELERKEENSPAKDLIKGISIYGERVGEDHFVSLDAVVKIGTENRSLHVSRAPVKISSNGLIPTLPIVLKAMDTTELIAGNSVYVVGLCQESSCDNIKITFEFNPAPGTKLYAVFLIQFTGQGYTLTETNIGEPETFETVYASLGGKAAEATAAAATTEKATTSDTTAGAEATTAETAAPADVATTETIPDATATTTAPKTDIGGVADIVTGANDVEVVKEDAPGVGVLFAEPADESPEIDRRKAEATVWTSKITDSKPATAVAKPAITPPPVAAKPTAEATRLAAQRRAEAQRKAGAYRDRGAVTKKKLVYSGAR